jgi:hypothetical protein
VNAEQLINEFRLRQEAEGPFMAAARNIATAYDGAMVVPVPEGLTKAAVANLIRVGVDHVGMRVADPPETVMVPARSTGKRAEERAEAQRRAGLGLLEASKYRLIKRERARHLVGYGRSPVLVRPDFDAERPTFEALDPLLVLPDRGSRREMCPRDVIVTQTQTFGWLRAHYPEQAAAIYKGYRWDGQAPDLTARFRIYRYESAEQCLLVLGTRADRPQDAAAGSNGECHAVVLRDYANPAGVCQVVVPDIVTMTSGGHSIFEQMIGMYEGRAELQALSIEAVRRGVFQEEWLEARQNETPEVVQTPDPMSGEIGVVTGGAIRPRPVDPQFMQNTTLDRMEYAERQTGGIPSEFGGQASTNVRTGRRGAQILSSTVDYPVAEAQELMAYSLGEELGIAAKVDKAWFRAVKRSWWVQWKGARGRVEYSPGEMWATEPTFIVSHDVPGMDAADTVVVGGQLVGMGAMSKKTLMKFSPLITDVEDEHDDMITEQLEAAFLASLTTMAASPEGPWQPADFASFARKVDEEGMTLYEATEAVQREAQERQAAQVPEGAPETMPGLSPPGQGAEAGLAIPDPTTASPSSGNLQELLAGLVRPQQMGGVR